MTPEEREVAIAKLDYEDHKAEIADRLRFQVEFAQSVLKGLMLVNGGAIVALFTFIGNSPASINSVLIKDAFGCFALGLGATLLSTMGAFFSQSFYMRCTITQGWNAQDKMHGTPGARDYVPDYRKGEFAETIGILMAFFGLAAFLMGSWRALSGVLV